MPEKEAQTTAKVTFKNPCYDTSIQMMEIEEPVFEANLWEPIFYELPVAWTERDCGPIEYNLRGLSDPDTYQLVNDDDKLGFWIRLQDASQTEKTPFTFEACITIGEEKNCKLVEDLVV